MNSYNRIIFLVFWGLCVGSNATAQQPNIPPAFQLDSPLEEENLQEWTYKRLFTAIDPDGDTLTYYAEGLPEGATLDRQTGLLVWKPNDGQHGKHVIRVFASDGKSTSQPLLVIINNVEEWQGMFLPGAYFVTYFPSDSTLGTYMGVGLEIAPFAWIHLNDGRGPSHGRIFARVELLTSSKDEAPSAFIYAFGASLTVENNPTRRWLIPYLGLDLGGIVQDDLGHSAQVTPHVGIYLWADRNISLGIQGGYVIAPERLDDLRGWKLAVGGSYTLW